VLPANRGSAMGAFIAFLDIAYGVAGPAAGLVAGLFGYAAVYLLGAASAVLGAALVVTAHRRITMSRIFISGSSTGLGLMAGELLVKQGHQVVLHARNAARADDARRALPRAEAIVEGDLGTIAGTKAVAAQINELGRFDAVIHNAAVGYRERHHLTADGLPHVFAINTLSAYILTALVERPHRLVYLSSGMHHHADANLDDILWRKRRWNGSTAYAESKLHDTMLAFAVARLWPDVLSNSLEPGWVPTKMGGAGAPDDMSQAHLTQGWLAVSNEPQAKVTGGYFYHLHPLAPNPQAKDPALQHRLIEICTELSGVTFPA
jgi:NAD(P)-dependent dehydrogenase (short-subunit alcohol dehydrogenase family)